jgi:Putative restriction endonuclease
MQARRRRFTSDEVLRMVQAGILAEDEPVELLDGDLIVVARRGPLQCALATRARRALDAAFGPGHHTCVHSEIDAGAGGNPAPDVAVVRGDEVLLDRHPAGPDLALVVEISVTSHALDEAKAEIYAAAGVFEYWQIEVPERRLIVRTDPIGATYRVTRIYLDGDDVPVAGGTIPLARLLP